MCTRETVNMHYHLQWKAVDYFIIQPVWSVFFFSPELMKTLQGRCCKTRPSRTMERFFSPPKNRLDTQKEWVGLLPGSLYLRRWRINHNTASRSSNHHLASHCHRFPLQSPALVRRRPSETTAWWTMLWQTFYRPDQHYHCITYVQ